MARAHGELGSTGALPLASVSRLRPVDPPSVAGSADGGALLDEAGERVAQAMGALLRLRLDRPVALGGAKEARALASSFELSQLVGHFLTIRDPEQRRYCLAVLRSCALADETARGPGA